MGLTVVTPPSTEPITLADAKDHLRVEVSDDDTRITRLISAARQSVERETCRRLVEQTIDWTVPSWPSIRRLPIAPVRSIAQITYLDGSGNQQTLAASSYQSDLVSEPGCIALAPSAVWPTLETDRLNPITVRLEAGYAVSGGDYTANIPKPLIQALLLIIGHWHRHLDELVIGASISQIPRGAAHLLDQYRLTPSWVD